MSRKKGTSSAELNRIARQRFGYERLTEGQEEAIRAVVEGHDTLTVMPTGAGKSAIYQISALMMDGPTVVVCPLIALQRDQVTSIEQQAVAPAAVLNSAVSETARDETLDDLEDGDLEFVFMAPEQFRKQETLERLKEAKPSLFVVDEAHCITEWGHDFRPDYLNLGAVIRELGSPTTLALTATAAPQVRKEIVERLGMRDPRVIVRGFDRPNIWMGVRTFPKDAEKTEALLEAVEEAEKPGIVYTASRRHAEEVSNALSDRGLRVAHYHGGMSAKERGPIQDDFMKGELDVIVATSAFGMGIDKPDVRFVFHYDVSDSVDAYYQEIGRAGRDGKPARAVLFYRPEDLNIHRFLNGGGKLDEVTLAKVALEIHAAEGPVDTEDLRETLDLSKTKVARAISRLEEVGAVEKLPTGEVAAGEEGADLRAAAQEAAKVQQELNDYRRLTLEKMQAYAELLDCRRNYILNYFGEDTSERCGHCDNDEKPREQREPREQQPARTSELVVDERPFPLKSRVLHTELGRGTVQEYEGGKVTILFDEQGKKTLSLEMVMERGLLERAS